VVPTYAAVTAISVALTAVALAQDRPWFAGVLVGAVAIGSAMGGLWWGSRADETRKRARLPGFLAVATVSCSLLIIGAGAANWIVLACVLAGLPMAPALGAIAGAAADAAPDGMHVEAQAWVVALNQAGAALGAIVAATIAQEYGSGVAVAVPAAFLGLASLLAVIRPLGKV
jgi:MFS family permease